MSKILNFLTNQPESLENMVERVRVLHRQIKQLEVEAIEIKAKITERMGDVENVFNTKGHLIATYKHCTRTSFNQKQFEADFPDQYENYKVITTFRTFLLK